MIKQNTLLILGAGASFDYRFPLGSELRWQILDRLKNQMPCFRALAKGLEDSGLSEAKAHIIEFHKALKGSGKNSVDAFLEDRTEFIPIGKIAIAMMLLPKEQGQFLFNEETRNWYQLLYEQLLGKSFEDFGSNNLSVITFNYDRSLEHYLLTVLHNDYGKSSEECAEQLKSIPIIHVHGKLGDLPGLGNDVIGYDSLKHYSSIFGAGQIIDEHLTKFYKLAFKSSKSIKIIHEDIEKDEEFKMAHFLIDGAREIHFLGFGFHPMNLERLDIKGFATQALEIYGTAFDYTAKQLQTIAKFKLKNFESFLYDFNKFGKVDVRKLDIYNYLKYHRTFR